MGSNLCTWLRFLWRNGKHINWKFYPKLVVITLMICLYAPLRFWERLRFDRRIRETKVKSPVFILGHQRSGTTYLHYLLGRDPQFGYLSVKESFMPWIYLTAKRHLEWMLGRNMPDQRPMDNLRLGMDLPTEPEYALGNMTVSTMLAGYMIPSQLKEVFKKTVLFEDETAKKEWQAALRYSMQKLTLLHGGKRILSKAPEDLGRVKEILEVFPDAKFIHIYRDPYRVYFSTERLYEITLPLVALQYVKDYDVKRFIVEAYRDSFTRYFEARKLVPEGNLVEIKYEDFIGNEMEMLREAYQSLGMDFEAASRHINAEVKSYEGYQTNKYEYDSKRMEEIYTAWEPIFKELGYSK